MSAGELARFDELVSRYLDDELTKAEAGELVDLLAEPPLAARFLEMARMNSEIAGLLAAPVPDEAMVELVRADIENSDAGNAGVSRLEHLLVVEPMPRDSIPAVIAASHPVLRHKKSVWPRLAWAAVFVFFAGLAAGFLVNRTKVAQAPAITFVQGEVLFVGPAGERVPRPGESWQQGEKLMTLGINSSASLKFHDGSQLDFSDNAVAVNEASKRGCRVRIEHGVIQAVVQKQPAPSTFVFATPEAEAIVVGTALRFVASLHSTRLEVSEGEVRFRRLHDGAEITVKSGSYAVVGPNVLLAPHPMHAQPHHTQ